MRYQRVASVALATALALAPLSAGSMVWAMPVLADTTPTTQAADAVPYVAVNGWMLDSTYAKGGETLEAADGWTHFKAGANNGNGTGDNNAPALAVSDQSFDFSQAGSMHVVLKSAQEKAKTRFGFYLGYKGPGDGLFVGYDAGGWFYQLYQGGDGKYQSYGAAIPTANTPAKILISWTADHKVSLTVDGQQVFSGIDFSSIAGNLSDKIAMKAGYWSNDGAATDVYIRNFGAGDFASYQVTGKVQGSDGPVAGARVRLDGTMTATSQNDGSFTFDDIEEGTHTLTIAVDGYDTVSQNITVSGGALNVGTIQLNAVAPVATEILKTEQMKVAVKQNFPSVLQYTMTALDNKVMYGQSNDVRMVAINDTNITLGDDDVTFEKNSDTKATYTLHVVDAAKNIDATITVVISVEKNILHFNVTKIVNNADKSGQGEQEQNPIQTLSFPNQSLISVRSTQDGAQFTGALMSSDTNKNGDTNINVTEQTSYADADFMYGFVSGGSLSAGLWSNSEHNGRAVATPAAGGSQNTRVYATTEQVGTSNSLGLASAPWYYHRVVTDSKKRTYVVNETAMPKISVAIAGDDNADGKVNWEDGAIAYRDIMNNPYKSAEVPELVAYRIAMNFGGQAQNPFLTTLDNVKKVALNTDGLGQSVLLKGYANEGHDSGHPDYGDIGQRIGGAKDMNILMEEGKAYGARFGVHVNASEMYPEAKAFNEDMVRTNTSGGLRYGWNWLDQGIAIDGIYDLASGARAQRFSDLKKQVGDNLDFIYLDVWGNQTSGSEDSWETRKISQTINDNGWRMSNEWGSANEYDSTFQHWAADLTYGGSTSKGENSQVMRFLRNHQKDSWVGDYPSYGGAANAPLLGGYNMKDFEGWQGRNDYAAYITNLYRHDVSTKFLQHFKVTNWVNSPLDATSVQDATLNNGNEQITLKDDNGNVVIVSRGSNDTSNAAYRQRTITFNGVEVSHGAVTAGDSTIEGDESYLLPWLWNAQTGKMLDASQQKLYHWNTNGGTTTWTLPQQWQGLSSVKVYQLTDQGKTNERTVAVSNGQIALEAEAETPYVIYQGEQSQIAVQWSQGMHVVDAGFNGGQNTLTTNWQVSGKGTAAVEGSNNPMLQLTGNVSVSQKMNDLKAGQRYAVYVGVDNRTAGNASLKITVDGKVVATNTTGTSIAKNYVKAYGHNTNSNTEHGSSYFQNMYVWFVAPTDGDATVTMALQSKDQDHAYFDDVRIVENNYDGLASQNDGTLQKLTNDFENNAQGLWPFVVSGSEGVEDNRVHLSELHAPYTQAGWDVKKMDDVLDGKWSVKINGLVQKNTLVMQTIPQNVCFKPGETYRVSFNYQSGSDGIYAVAVGQGQFSNGSVKLRNLPKALGADGHEEFEITGGIDGDSWFGIYSTSTAPDLQGTTGSAAAFGGYQDFVLDNLTIEHVESTTRTKAEVQAKFNEISAKYDAANFSEDAWLKFQNMLVGIKVLINKDGATEQDYTSAYNLLMALDDYMSTAPGSEASDRYDVANDAYTVSAGSAQSGNATEGEASYAQDGKDNTWWHTQYGADSVSTGKAWYQFDLKQPTTINGLRYLPRNIGMNGRIKDYEITLTTSDGTTRTVSAGSRDVRAQSTITGTFSTNAVWQKTSFDPVNNVISVRLTVKSSAGSTDGEANHYASAAELRLTTNRDVVPVEPTVDRDSLQEAIAQAESLRAGDYTADSWARLQTALAAARAVQADTNADAYTVALTTANLTSAIQSLVPNTTSGNGPTEGVGNIDTAQPGPSEPGKGTPNGKPSDTGSSVGTVVLTAGLLLAAGIAVVVSRRRS